MTPYEVLYDFDGPRIFTFKEKSELYFACWSDEDSREKRTRYLVVPIGDNDVAMLKQGTYSLVHILDKQILWVVDRNFDNEVLDVKCLSGGISSVPDGFKPEKDAMLCHRSEIVRRQSNELHQALSKKLKDFLSHREITFYSTSKVSHYNLLTSYLEAQKNATTLDSENWNRITFDLNPNTENHVTKTALRSRKSDLVSDLGMRKISAAQHASVILDIYSTQSTTLERAQNYDESQERVMARLLN